MNSFRNIETMTLIWVLINIPRLDRRQVTIVTRMNDSQPIVYFKDTGLVRKGPNPPVIEVYIWKPISRLVFHDAHRINGGQGSTLCREMESNRVLVSSDWFIHIKYKRFKFQNISRLVDLLNYWTCLSFCSKVYFSSQFCVKYCPLRWMDAGWPMNVSPKFLCSRRIVWIQITFIILTRTLGVCPLLSLSQLPNGENWNRTVF